MLFKIKASEIEKAIFIFSVLALKVKVRDFEAMKGIDYIAETNTD